MEVGNTPYSDNFEENIKHEDFLEKSLGGVIDKEQFLITSLMVLVTEDITPEILSQIYTILDKLDNLITIKYFRPLENLFSILVEIVIKKNTLELKELLVYFVNYSSFFKSRILMLLIKYNIFDLVEYVVDNSIVSSNLIDLISSVSTGDNELIKTIAYIYHDITEMDPEYYYLQSYLEWQDNETKDIIKSNLPFNIFTS